MTPSPNPVPPASSRQAEVNFWPLTEISLSDVRPRVGTRCQSRTIEYRFRGGDDREFFPYVALFYWKRPIPYNVNPHHRSFLNVEAWGPGGVAFGGRDQLSTVCGALNRRPPLKTERIHTNDMIIAHLKAPGDIALQFTIDTEDEFFLQEARDHADLGAAQPFAIEVHYYLFDGREVDDQGGTIRLLLGSSDQPVFDDGLVGIDLGHTGTTVAYLPPLGSNRAAMQVLDARGRPSADCRNPSQLGVIDQSAPAVESNVLLTNIRADDPECPPDSLDWARWEVGVKVGSAETESLFVSVKRLMAERDMGRAAQEPGRVPRSRRVLCYRTFHPKPNEHKAEQDISSRLPAELFFCRLFQRFREATCRTVRKFALTYPTTFSQREMDVVRETAYRGWLRMLDLPQDDFRLEDREEEVRARIPLVLDEASAAGYFFLHRRLFDRPHGVAGFRYHYPHGFNLLLFDCGGGTIDIGILRAEVLDKPQRIKVTVVGRSGKRSFGGDNITETVFRLLKAQLAIHLAGLGVGPPRSPKVQLPDSLDQLEDWLDREANYFNQVLPTRFNPDHLGDAEANRRRRFTQNLWLEAERIKHALGNEQAVKLTMTDGSPASKYLQQLPGMTPERWTQLQTKFRSIEVRREQVDTLIREDVRDSVDRCNHLIWEKLTHKGQEVDWVVAAGNGTRYPLFHEEMKRRLAVHFLDLRMEPFPEEEQANLKYAVAKGVTLALASGEEVGGIQVEFDHTLCDRIPFDLGYRDRKRNEFVELLLEDRRYDDLANGSPPLEVHVREGADNDVLLYRRWPGETHFWPYLQYRFEEPIRDRDTITVRYDKETRRFVVQSGSEEGKLIQEIVEDLPEEKFWKTLSSAEPHKILREIYFSPVQRGTL